MYFTLIFIIKNKLQQMQNFSVRNCIFHCVLSNHPKGKRLSNSITHKELKVKEKKRSLKAIWPQPRIKGGL